MGTDWVENVPKLRWRSGHHVCWKETGWQAALVPVVAAAAAAVVVLNITAMTYFLFPAYSADVGNWTTWDEKP